MMRNCRCNNNVEHYIVHPNVPVKDWHCEYSNGECPVVDKKCCEGMFVLCEYINNLCSQIGDLQNAIASNPSSGLDAISVGAIVNNAITERLRDIDTQFAQLAARIPENISNLFDSIWAKLRELESSAGDNTNPTDLSGINSQLSSLSNRLSSVESQLRSLSVDNIKQQVLDSITNSFGGRITTLEGNYTTLNTNVSNLSGNLQSHINNTECHVTTADKARWNAASGATGGWDIHVTNKTLDMSYS